ncbi:hypothetical protein LJC34_03040 [Oscillospiraceae bacterium OttesenSCG-928-G22]|nr:hypothetical protein [Oscillospiraceae bacterium OttesenSCG-928-G22]
MKPFEKNNRTVSLFFASDNRLYLAAFALLLAAYFTRISSTGMRAYPAKNTYYQGFRHMADDLGGKTGGKIASVYMVGEGEISPEFLRRVKLPEQADATPFLMENSIVDLRDGFPSQLFVADYVLVTDPFVTDFTETQQVSYQVYDLFLNALMIGGYYETDMVYPLGDHELTLFRKIKPADRNLVDHLKRRIQSYYPDTPSVYEPNYFLAFSEFESSLQYYNFWEGYLDFNTYGSGCVEFHINDTTSFSGLSFELSCDTTGLVLTAKNQDGEIYRAAIESGARATHSIPCANSAVLDIAIESADAQIPAEGIIRLHFEAESLQ